MWRGDAKKEVSGWSSQTFLHLSGAGLAGEAGEGGVDVGGIAGGANLDDELAGHLEDGFDFVDAVGEAGDGHGVIGQVAGGGVGHAVEEALDLDEHGVANVLVAGMDDVGAGIELPADEVIAGLELVFPALEGAEGDAGLVRGFRDVAEVEDQLADGDGFLAVVPHAGVSFLYDDGRRAP